MKKFKIALFSLTLAFILSICMTPFAIAENARFMHMTTKMKVAATTLNVRSGPGTQFPKVATLKKGQTVDCVGKVSNWCVLHLDNNVIGMVSTKYLTPVGGTAAPAPKPAPAPVPKPTTKPSGNNSQAPAPNQPQTPSTPTGGDEQQQMLNLVNQARASAGVPALTMDSEVMKVAQIKAQDMVSKNYFSHTSPTYGSPFDMLKQFGVKYTYAGENLAGNSSVQKAHDALMNSQGHRENILNSNYRYIGIGIQNSPTYGKIYVQMFINK